MLNWHHQILIHEGSGNRWWATIYIGCMCTTHSLFAKMENGLSNIYSRYLKNTTILSRYIWTTEPINDSELSKEINELLTETVAFLEDHNFDYIDFNANVVKLLNTFNRLFAKFFYSNKENSILYDKFQTQVKKMDKIIEEHRKRFEYSDYWSKRVNLR